jgi:hypothetical protein
MVLAQLYHAQKARIATHQVDHRFHTAHLAPQAPLIPQLGRQLLVVAPLAQQALTALVKLEPHQFAPLEHIALLEHPIVLFAELEVIALLVPNLKHPVQPAHIAPQLANKLRVQLEHIIIVLVLYHV